MHKYDLNLREYWRIIKRRKLIIIFTVVVMGVFSFISAILGKPVPIYKTGSTVQVQRSPAHAGPYWDYQLSGATNQMETQTHVIRSYYTLELTAKQMGLIPADLPPEAVRQNNKYVNIITDLQERVHTEQRGNSDLIDITVSANEPKFVTNFCNTLTEVYKTQYTLDLNRKTIEGKRFIEGQFAHARDKLSNAEEAVKVFREANRWTTIDSETLYLGNHINRVQDLYSQDSLTLQKVNAAEQMLSAAEFTPLGSSKSFYFDEAAPPYKALNDRLVSLMMERDTLLLTYTDDFPQVQAIKVQVHDTAQAMQSHLKAQAKSLISNLAIYKRQLGDLNVKLKALPGKNLVLVRLSRDADIAKELYTVLEKRYQEARILEAEKLEEVKVVKPAIEPALPVNPPKVGTNTLLGTLLGLILGIVFAFLIETFDTSIGAIEEVEEFLGVHVMGIIPFVSFEEIKTLLSDDPNAPYDESKMRRYARLVAHFVPSSTLSESYKALRTSINFVCAENNLKTILFTSSSPGEGKTSIVVNVAITMAQAGQKVLLLDGDLRRPVISKLFGIEQVPGLTDLILGNYEWPKVVKSVADFMTGKMSIEDIMKTPGMDNLHIITSGTFSPNPAEILNSKALGEFINQARAQYDIILVDAPPVLAATDAALWSSRVDGSILVYQVGKIARGALKRSKISLENLKANVLGVVLNGLKAEISPDFGEDYYYYYNRQDTKPAPFYKRIWDKFIKGQTTWSHSGIPRKKLRRKPERPAPVETPIENEENPPEQTEKLSSLKTETKTVEAESLPESSAESTIEEPLPVEPQKKKTPGWLKVLMLIFLVILLVAGLIFQFRGIQQQKAKIKMSAHPRASIDTKLIPPVQAEILKPTAAPAVNTDVEKIDDTLTRPEKKAVSDETKPASGPSAAAPSAPPASKTASALQQSRGDKCFSIQVKSVPTADEARGIVEALKGKGETAFIEHVALKDRGEWNRVLIGRFESVEEAEIFMKAKKLDSIYPGSIVQKTSAKMN